LRRTVTKNGKKTIEVVYLITSTHARTADPATLAAWVRSHWHIGRVAPALCGAGAPSEPGERAFPAPRLKQARRRRG
jgi:hypothetical protein